MIVEGEDLRAWLHEHRQTVDAFARWVGVRPVQIYRWQKHRGPSYVPFAMRNAEAWLEAHPERLALPALAFPAISATELHAWVQRHGDPSARQLASLLDYSEASVFGWLMPRDRKSALRAPWWLHHALHVLSKTALPPAEPPTWIEARNTAAAQPEARGSYRDRSILPESGR